MSTEIVKSNNSAAQFNYFNADQFATMQRVCSMFASSELVPKMYRVSQENPKERAIANCMIAVETAQRIGASPLMVMQNMYIVHGNPGWSAKFLIATVNSCGKYNTLKYRMTNLGKIKFDGKDIDNWECVACTTEKGSDEILESVPVDIKMAIDEGWYGKAGSKWKTMPKLMLHYRSAAFWTRTHAPELSMGMNTAEEIEDYVDYEDVSEKVDTSIKANANKQPLVMDDNKTEVKNEPSPEPVKVAENQTAVTEECPI